IRKVTSSGPKAKRNLKLNRRKPQAQAPESESRRNRFLAIPVSEANGGIMVKCLRRNRGIKVGSSRVRAERINGTKISFFPYEGSFTTLIPRLRRRDTS